MLVRHARRLAGVDQPEVADVLQVPHLVLGVRAGEDRLDHAAHPLLLQLVRQLVEVRAPGEDQLLARRVDVLHVDGAGAVAPGLAVEAGPGAQRVHQPRLAAGVFPHRPARRRREALSGFQDVLQHQPARLLPREVAQAQGLRRHVERAAAGDHLAGARLDSVVSDVPHAAQHDAVREAPRPLLVAGAQLAQHREQGVAHQRVDLVDQQHQRRRVRQAPLGQQFLQGVAGTGLLEHAGPSAFGEIVAHETRSARQAAQDGTHAFRHVVVRHLAAFHVHVHAAVVARFAAVQEVAQSDEGGGFAGLPGGVEYEVALVLDQVQDLADVAALEGRNRVVLLLPDRAFGVEKAHGFDCGTVGFVEAIWRRRTGSFDSFLKPLSAPVVETTL